MTSLNTTTSCSTCDGSNGYYHQFNNEVIPIASKTDFEKEISSQDKFISRKFLEETLNNCFYTDSKFSDFRERSKAEIVLYFVNHVKSVCYHEEHIGAYLIEYLDKTIEQQEEEAEWALAVLTSEWIKKDIQLNQETPILEEFIAHFLKGIQDRTDLSKEGNYCSWGEEIWHENYYAASGSTSDLTLQKNSSVDKINKIIIKTSLDTAVACNTSQKYDYQEPDIVKQLLPVLPQTNFEGEISPQDKYISSEFLKLLVEEIRKRGEDNLPQNPSGTTSKSDLVCLFVQHIKSTCDTNKYAGAYLIDYLDKTKVQQEEEGEFALATLTSEWIQNKDIITDQKEQIIVEKNIRGFFNSPRKKMNPRSNTWSYHSDVTIAPTDSLYDKIYKIINNSNDKTPLNNSNKDLEHISTHVVYGLNEEVQKLSEKSSKLEANALETYSINVDKDTKIAQLTSKVDALQQEILELKAINEVQAKTIQEFELRQMKMEEKQELQRQLFWNRC